MALRVIGAGFGRTGTLSLKFALEKLGFDKCYHMMEVGLNEGHHDLWLQAGQGLAVDWSALFADYQAAVDWPSSNFWEAQMAAFPDAKVILSVRDSDKWYDSVMNTIWQATQANAKSDRAEARAGAHLAYEVIWDAVFQRRMDDRAHVIACYEAHNQRVIEGVPRDRLLVYVPGDGWEPLCEFLETDVPGEPYPRVNTTEEFTERWRKIAQMQRDKP